MLEFLTMLTLFVQPIFSVILSIFSISIQSGQMGIMFAIVAIIDYIYVAYYVVKHKGRIHSSLFRWIIIILFFLVFTIVFSFFYKNGMYLIRSSFLSFGSITATTILLGCLLSIEGNLRNLGKWIPLFTLIITLVCVISLLFGNLANTGLIRASNNIGYQNGAYFSSYAFGLNLFYLTYYEDLEHFVIFKRIKVVFVILPFIQPLAVVVAGGRGGFVLAAILVLYFAWINRKRVLNLEFGIRIIIILVVGIYVAFAFFSNKISSGAGALRLLNFLNDRSDSNRSVLWIAAIECFKDKPIFGNGIGSVWYLIGVYSHNLFTDILCEYGIVGLFLVVFVLIDYFIIQLHASKKACLHNFAFLIFIFGFTMSMFSGYYMSNAYLWFPIVYIFSLKDNKFISKGYNSFD